MNRKTRLDIPLLLPEVDDPSDACVGRLLADLKGRPGISDAHVVLDEGKRGAMLCVHHDPDVIPLARIRQIAQSSGAAITSEFGHLNWNVDGIRHQRRANSVAEALRKLTGVLEASASVVGTIHVEFRRSEVTEETIRKALAGLDVTIRHVADAPEHMPGDGHSHGNGDGHDHAHGGIFGANSELYFALLSGAFLAIGFGLEKLSALPATVSLACYIAAYFSAASTPCGKPSRICV